MILRVSSHAAMRWLAASRARCAARSSIKVIQRLQCADGPPRRVKFCEGCCCHFGTYIRTCDSDLIECRRAGRSVMVVSDGGDLAVTCVIRCRGGERCRMSTNASGHCNLYDLPGRVIDRATEAVDHKIGQILFRPS